MALSSLLITLVRSVLPYSSIVGTQKLPFEIIGEIIDNLESEKSCLLSLSLVCRYTLQRSRALLFETLTFSNGEGSVKFDRFLDLLEGPPTTFATWIKNIHITELSPRTARSKPRHAVHRLAPKLSHLKSIQLASLKWSILPPHYHDFLLALSAVEVSMENMPLYTTEHLIEIFKSPLITQGSQELTLYNFRLDEGPNSFPNHLDLFEKNYHFRAIDSTSLVNFCNVWDPARNKAKIIVNSFYLRLYGSGWRVERTYLPFLQNFLLETGSNLESFVVDLPANPDFDEGLLTAYTQLDLSSCTALRTVHVGIIDMDERRAVHMDTTWKILESIPPSTVETVGLIFDARAPLHDLAVSLQSFPWIEAIQRIQGIFSSCKRIKIKIGAYDIEKNALTAEVDFLSRALHSESSELSAEVSFEASIWTSFYVSLDRLYWRDFTA